MVRVMGERADVVPLLAEVFRAYGYEGASLARIAEGTGLGKGSIYNFFPGGKEEMAAAVLAEIDAWFRDQVFQPLRDGDGDGADAHEGVADMFTAVERYFLSGRKVCLVGVFALGHERDRFADKVRAYFAEWVEALALALARDGTRRTRRARWPRMSSAAFRARWCWRARPMSPSCSRARWRGCGSGLVSGLVRRLVSGGGEPNRRRPVKLVFIAVLRLPP